MKRTRNQTIAVWLFSSLALCLLPGAAGAHVTLQTSQSLRPKGGYANVTLNVPNERHVDNTKITLEVPEAFLKAGGRINRVQYPPGWTLTLEKKDKPSDVYGREMKRRDSQKKEQTEKRQAAGPRNEAQSDMNQKEDPQVEKILDEMRKKWITKVLFEGGAIPPDGYQQFQISLQLPDEPGRYRFTAVQTYADGKDVSWSELVEGAEHPAATLNIQSPPWISYGDLPLPLSAAALLISCLAFFRRS